MVIERLTRARRWLGKWFRSRLGRLDPGWLAAAAIPLPGIALTFPDGIVRAADSAIHLHRLYAMQLAYQAGDFWPRWITYFHLGYGYPIFNFYPPLVYHLGGLLGLPGIGAVTAYNLIMAGAWLLGTLGAYRLGRAFLPGSASILAALLWAYAPSRLFEVWNQGSLAQTFGAALIPWIALAAASVARRPARRGVAGLAIPTAALAMTHLPLVIMTAVFLVPGSLLLVAWEARSNWRAALTRLLALGAGAILALGLAAIFVLPVAGELGYVAAADQDPVPELLDNFLEPRDLVRQPAPLDRTDAQFLMLPTMGLSWLVLAVLGLGGLLWRRRLGAAAILALGLLALVFLIQEAALPVWTTVPFLANARFAWRFFRIGALIAALAGGGVLLVLPPRRRGIGLAVLLPLVLLTALPWLLLDKPIQQWDNLSALDEIRYEETAFHWGTTSYNEFNPHWGETVAWDPAPDKERYAADPFHLDVQVRDRLEGWPDLQSEPLGGGAVRVTLTEGRPVRFRQYYYPGWTATLDGAPVAITPDTELGLITVDVPAGAHTVTLTYTGTPLQWIATLISLLSVGMTGFLLGSRRATGEAPPGEAQPRPYSDGDRVSRRAALAVAGGIAAFTLANTLILKPHTPLFRLDSPPDAPATMQTPVHARFGSDGAVELLGYTLEPGAAAPGGTLDLTLYWRVHGELPGRVVPHIDLAGPLSDVYGEARIAVSLNTQFSGDPTPDRFVSIFYRLDVTADAPPYAARLRVTVDAGQDGPLLTADGNDVLWLEPPIPIEGSDPPAPARLDVRLGGSLALTCAALTPDHTQLTLDLHWRVDGALGGDYTTFVHGLDAEGTLVAQGDGPPLEGRYPTSLWRPGQHLSDQYVMAADDSITALAVGLYLPTTGDRLPITRDGQPQPDDRLILPLADLPSDGCLP